MKIKMLFSACLLISSAIGFAKEERPNVLMISIDDLNDWVGCMKGHPNVKTPNIDRLAKQGLLFKNANCPAPICGPSRAAIMTGVSPSSSGIYGQISDKDLSKPFNGDIVYLSNWFSNNGYHTLSRGKVFHGRGPEGAFLEDGGRSIGFGPKPQNRFKWDKAGTGTDWGAFPEDDKDMKDYEVAKWAAQRLKSLNKNKPFFMAVGFIRPHTPFYAPPKWFKEYPLSKVKLPPYKRNDFNDLPQMAYDLTFLEQMPSTQWAIEEGEWKSIVQAYLACVSFVDDCVGTVLDALEESGHAENTIVVLWSDHGYHLGEKNRVAKHSLWERSARVPLIFSGPGIPQGRKTKGAVSLLDMYPTLLELCGLPKNSKNEGVSLMPLIKRPSAVSRKVWKHLALTTYGKGNHSVRSRNYRYIVYADGSEELYDMRTDPNEWENLAGKKEYIRIKKYLRRGLPKNEKPWSEFSKIPSGGPYFLKLREKLGRECLGLPGPTRLHF